MPGRGISQLWGYPARSWTRISPDSGGSPDISMGATWVRISTDWLMTVGSLSSPFLYSGRILAGCLHTFHSDPARVLPGFGHGSRSIQLIMHLLVITSSKSACIEIHSRAKPSAMVDSWPPLLPDSGPSTRNYFRKTAWAKNQGVCGGSTNHVRLIMGRFFSAAGSSIWTFLFSP